MIQKLFEIIEPTHRFCAEFGAGDGIKNSNSRHLILNGGWSSLQIEGDEAKARLLEHNYKDHPNVKTLQTWVWPGNIEMLFRENGVPKDLDFLVIMPFEGRRVDVCVEIRKVLFGFGVPKDVMVLTSKEFEERKDIPGTVAYPAAREGRVLYAA